MNWCFMADFANCAKRKINEENQNEILAARISEMAGAIFFSNLVCRLPYLASTSVANLVPIG